MADFGKDALGVIRAVAPAIATALGGPLAGLAVNAIANAFDRPGAEPNEIGAAIAAAGPDDLLRLKQADQAFAAQMRSLDIQDETVAAGDRADARARQIAVHDNTPAYLAYALTVGFFGLIGIMAFHPLPADNARLIDILLGSLGTAWVGAMAFFFGSSSGSRAKDTLLAAAMPADMLGQITAHVAAFLPAPSQPVMEPVGRVESPGAPAA